MSIEGRCDDALRLPARRGGEVTVVPLALETVLEEHAGAHEFQVVQGANGGLTIHLGAHERSRRAPVRAALRRYFETCEVGPVEIVVSRRAPARDPASGKLRRVVCQLDR